MSGNRIKLTVGGMDLLLKTEDDEAYLQAIGNEVNHRIYELTRDNPFMSVTMAAVFVALDNCDKAKKAAIDAVETSEKIKDYSNQLACARIEADEARREIERLNKENQMLRAQLTRK